MMKAKDYRIEVREAARFVLRDAEPSDMSGYKATGRVREWNFTGDYDALAEKFEEMLALGTYEAQRQCVLTRGEGGMAELVVTETGYEEDTGAGGGGGGEAWYVGGSADNPLYEYSFAETAEPILTHPLIAGVYGEGEGKDDDVMSALQMVAQGGMDNAIIYLSDGKQSDVKSFLEKKGVSAKVRQMVRNPSYIDVRTRLTVSYEVDKKTSVADLGKTYVVKTPPGPLETPENRQWMYVGGGYRKQGKKVYRQEVYLLSGPKGWDTDIYGGGSEGKDE